MLTPNTCQSEVWVEWREMALSRSPGLQRTKQMQLVGASAPPGQTRPSTQLTSPAQGATPTLVVASLMSEETVARGNPGVLLSPFPPSSFYLKEKGSISVPKNVIIRVLYQNSD